MTETAPPVGSKQAGSVPPSSNRLLITGDGPKSDPVSEGEGVTETAGRRFEWKTSDIFVVPGFAWRHHINAGNMDAILYSVSDAPLLDKIGQYRAQGRLLNDTVAELVP